MKSNPYDNFTQAIDSMVLSEKPMQDRVLDAYTKHISRVEAENIPQKVHQIAKVILFIAEEIKKNQQTTDK
jgi:hypothetical protein